jgi:hypothetical protein
MAEIPFFGLTGQSKCSFFVLVPSSDGPVPKRHFPPPWRIERDGDERFCVRDATGFLLATIYCRDDLQQWSFGRDHLSSDEARRIATAIARLPDLLMQRQGFHPRGGGHSGWKPDRPYHVAIADMYLRERWDEINALCALNGISLDATGERIERGGLWRVYEFALQLHAIQFWDRFEGRWLSGGEFIHPERPKDLPTMKELKGWPAFDPRKARG